MQENRGKVKNRKRAHTYRNTRLYVYEYTLMLYQIHCAKIEIPTENVFVYYYFFFYSFVALLLVPVRSAEDLTFTFRVYFFSYWFLVRFMPNANINLFHMVNLNIKSHIPIEPASYVLVV